MSKERIDPIEEVVGSQKRRAAWGDLYQPHLPETSFVKKTDLSPQEIDCLDRTQASAHSSLAQTAFASLADQMPGRLHLSKDRPAGTNAVVDAAESTGIIRPPKLQSLFDLSGSMEKRNEKFPKPELAPPVSQNYLKLVLDMHGSMETVISDCANHLETETKKDLEELGKLREVKALAVEKHAHELANQQSWATLQNLASYIAYASSIAIGATLGGTAGYLLILAGSMGAAGNIAKDTGLMSAVVTHLQKSQESQAHTLQSLEFAMTLIPLTLGLVGSTMAAPHMAPTAFTWMAAALSASSKLGESRAIAKNEYLRGELETLDKLMLMLREKIKTNDHHMQDTLQKAKQLTQEVQTIFSNAELNLK